MRDAPLTAARDPVPPLPRAGAHPRRRAGEICRAWWQACRPKFYVATLVPVALGTALAAREGAWDAGRAGLTLLGALLLQTVANFANDYFDWVQYRGDVPFSGGSGVIQQGKLSPEAMRRATWATLAAAVAIGAYLASRSHPSVYAFTALGALSAVYYTAPPVRYGYRGLAELGCGLSMGPLITLGTYTVLTGRPSWPALVAGLPVASLVALILYGESIHDIAEDRATGKRTLAARLGEDRAIGLFALWVAATAAGTAAGALAGALPRLAALLLLPAAAVLHALRALRAKPRRREDLYAPGRWARRLYLACGALLVAGAALGW